MSLEKKDNQLEQFRDEIKEIKKNIQDTNLDHTEDTLQVRTSDGQLRINPSKEDLEQTIQELETVQKYVEKQLEILRNKQLKEKSKKHLKQHGRNL